MDSILAHIIDLKKKIHLLVSTHVDLKEVNFNLNKEKISLLEKVKGLEQEIEVLKKQVEVVDVVKGIEGKGGETTSFARGRVNNLIRKIDKCITLLNE